MSYVPKVGDRVRNTVDDCTGTLVHVVRSYGVVDLDAYDDPGVLPLHELVKVEPRPTVREHGGGMSYVPKVGDRVTLAPNHLAEYVVIGIHHDWVWLTGHDDHHYCTIVSRCTKVEPRPTIAQQNIGIDGGGWVNNAHVTNARIFAMSIDDLTVRYCLEDRIPVVTDLDGNPLEVRL